MKRRSTRVAAVLTLLCAVTAGSLGAPRGTRPAAAAPAAAITVNYAAPGPAINPLIYGTNSRYTNDWEGAWDPAADQVRPGFRATYEDVFEESVPGRASLRYPGGTVANTFRWRRAIGPNRQAQEIYDGSGAVWDTDSVARFGLDEAARFAESANSRLVYVYNFANGSAEDAADLVEYLNAPVGSNPNGGTAWALVRRDNGHAAPYDVRYFEIGNEVNLGGQDFWLDKYTYRNDPVTYARRYIYGADGHDGYNDYRSAMRAVGSAVGVDVEVYSALSTTAFIDEMGSTQPYDGLVTHLYANNLPGTGAAAYHDQAMVAAARLAAETLSKRNRMRDTVGSTRAAGMDVVATEYGILDGSQQQRQTLSQAIYVSKMLLDFMSQDMAFAQKHITTELDDPEADDGQEVIGSRSDGFLASATARAFKLFTHNFGDQLVSHTLETPERDAQAGGRIKQLQMRASRDDSGRLYLAVVNSNRGESGGGGDVTASVDINGYDPADVAEVRTLTGPSYTSRNTPGNPNTVVIQESTRTGVGDGAFTHTFPAHSVTIIELRR